MAIGMLESGATLEHRSQSAGSALEALQATPQELLDLFPLAVCICHTDGRLIRYNRRATELWQSRPPLNIPGGCFHAQTLYLPDGTRLSSDATPLALALRLGITTVGQEVVVERHDHSRLPARVHAAPFYDTEGNITGAIVCYCDGSNPQALAAVAQLPEQMLRENQQRLAATFEHAGIGIAEVDAAGRPLRINEAYCAITGYTRAELLGMSLHDLIHPEDREEGIKLHEQQARGQLDSYALERRHLCKDGTVRWVAVNSSAVRAPDGRFLYAVRVLRDISARKQAQERQHMLMGELNHRIKNILATVQSLAQQTIRRASDPADFYSRFQSRLMALSKAHSLLTRSQWRGATLHAIIEEQALPFREGMGQRIQLSGEAVDLQPDQAVVLGMIFHELLTNAIKHGSLSGLSGQVRIDWHTLEDAARPGGPWLQMRWQETDGPATRRPLHQGFGSVFIERSIRDQLHGNARLDFLPTGLVCRLEIPLHPIQ